MKINGKQVSLNDRLYHLGYDSWVVVKGLRSDFGSIEVPSPNGGVRNTVTFNEGGYINGKRQLYWVPPTVLEYNSEEEREAKLSAFEFLSAIMGNKKVTIQVEDNG